MNKRNDKIARAMKAKGSDFMKALYNQTNYRPSVKEGYSSITQDALRNIWKLKEVKDVY